ncbi:MAG: penicillin-binding transpeptidase domain-containing protein [Gemmiger formicilis]
MTVTPLQITAMMNTVANGGVYRTPAFVQGIGRRRRHADRADPGG